MEMVPSDWTGPDWEREDGASHGKTKLKNAWKWCFRWCSFRLLLMINMLTVDNAGQEEISWSLIRPPFFTYHRDHRESSVC